MLDGCIYVLGGRSHDKGSRMKHVHVYEPSSDRWESGTAFEERVSGLAACELLVPRSTLAQARGWGQRAKVSWEDQDFDNSDDSSDD